MIDAEGAIPRDVSRSGSIDNGVDDHNCRAVAIRGWETLMIWNRNSNAQEVGQPI